MVRVKLSAIFILLALAMAQVFAYDVGIKVTVSQDTLAVGTNISIVKDGTLLYSARAGESGTASFKLDAGSYFVYLDRGGYSRHVNLLEVSKNDNIEYTMRQLISYASVYGQVAGPSDFNGSSVAAYASGNIAKRTVPNKDGYYLMSFMPEGSFMLSFDAQGFVERNVSATLLQSQFSEVNVKLDKVPVAPAAQPALIVPSSVPKQTVIEILIMGGGVPLPGRVVLVKPPSGSVEATTGADGKAHVNAVAEGEYVFTYGNLTSKTMVGTAVNATAPPPAAVEPEPPAASEPEAPSSAGGFVAGAALIIMGGLIVALGIVLFAMGRMSRKQKPKAHGHEAQGLPPAGKHEHAKGGQGAAHQHEAHGHRKQK
ncbi:MAG: hypothetical protein WC861_04800 [Candidatus Micrarchaeia archaeon]